MQTSDLVVILYETFTLYRHIFTDLPSASCRSEFTVVRRVKDNQLLDSLPGAQVIDTLVVDPPRDYGSLHALGFRLEDGEIADATLDQVRAALAP